METTRPDLLPAYHLALNLQAFLQDHPEAEEAAVAFYGNRFTAQLVQAGLDVKNGIVGADRLTQILTTWAERLSRLAAPGGKNWN